MFFDVTIDKMVQGVGVICGASSRNHQSRLFSDFLDMELLNDENKSLVGTNW